MGEFDNMQITPSK